MGLSRGLSVVSATRDVCPRAGRRSGLGGCRLEVANSNSAAMVNPNFLFFIASSRCIPEFILQRATMGGAAVVQCTLLLRSWFYAATYSGNFCSPRIEKEVSAAGAPVPGCPPPTLML